jgi:uncharacterized SAM-binding protein YcdF (DUF218 family)
MFFFLSKVLAFLIMPYTWAIVLLLLAWRSKNEVRKRKFFIGAVIILLVFSNRFILNQAMIAWEISPVKDPAPDTYDAVIVLGGFSTYNEEFDRTNFIGSADRLMQGIRLTKNGVAPKLIVSGGSGSITFPDHLEGVRTEKYLREIGFPDSLLITENSSKNTYENAKFTAEILKKNNIKGKYLLITSGFHMRRSLGCFAKQGLTCDPYSVDMHGGEGRANIDYFLLPEVSVLAEWNILIHEWVGCLTYKFAGYL